MKSKKWIKVLAVVLAMLIALSIMPSSVFAEDIPQGEGPSEAQTEVMVEELPGEETEEATWQEQNDEPQQEDAITADEDPQKETGSEPSAAVEVKASSETNNIVGEVFANMFNNIDDPEMIAKREASLEEYPVDAFDLSYYEGSPRLRMTGGGSAEYPNYLVYRDSYLLISEEDSKNYEVMISEDGRSAYVNPAIPAEDLVGKIGIVFLSDDLGNDSILLFDGSPRIAGGVLAAQLKKTEDITINMLFSDGQIAAEEQPEQQSQRPLLRAGNDVNIDFELNDRPHGTNWQADISNFSPKWPSKPHAVVKVFDLLFEMDINLKFSLNYDITTRGSTRGRETDTIAGFTIPMGPFSISMNYNLQVEFDGTPMRVKGKMTTDFDYGIGTHGANIREYRTEVTVEDLQLLDQTNPQNFNRDINFYIGSQIEIKGEFLKLTIDIKIYKKTFGPVLKIAQESEGGARVTARYEKDQYSPPPDRIHNNKIHTCAQNGEAGCLCLTITETYKHHLYLKIDLYFKKWEPTLSGNDKTFELDTTQYHRSYTFGDTKILKGPCPHLFYKVPVRVWLDEEHTRPAPAGIDVSISDSLILSSSEEELVKDQTDDEGNAVLFLPYKEKYRYNCTASGLIEDHPAAGSSLSNPIDPKRDPPADTVHIVLKSEEMMTIRTNIIWDVDVAKTDVPHEYDQGFVVYLYRRAAGTDDDWVQYADIGQWVDEPEAQWNVDEWTVPKFGFSGNQAFFYEYRVRIYDEYSRVKVITPENNNCFILRYTGPYHTAIGTTDNGHTSQYHVAYDEALSEEAGTGDEVLTTDITLTAVKTVEITKKWQLTDPANTPESIYLALEQKPEIGWEDIAGIQGVPDEWTLMLNPITGYHPRSVGGTTLKELEDDGVLITEDYIGRINNTPLTLGKVTPDNSGLWRIMFMIPAYYKGVEMQYQGNELDGSAVERLLKNEYDLTTSASVTSAGDFLSVPGIARQKGSFPYHLDADVINLDLPEEGTLVGTVGWESTVSFYPYGVPESVDLHIYKDGVEIAESPITLYRSDYAEGGNVSNLDDVWVWTLKTADYDPDAEYTVKEDMPDKNWFPLENGLDVYNYATGSQALNCRIEALFDFEPEDVDIINVRIRNKETGEYEPTWDVQLTKYRDWVRYPVTEGKTKYDFGAVSDYQMEAPDIPGYVKTYIEPYEYNAGGQLGYNFTVSYTKQSEHLNLHIKKEWTAIDPSTVYPNEVNVKVYRDSELIADKKLKKKLLSDEWAEIEISEDADGNDLKRVAPDGHKYNYIVVEEPVDGFTSSVAVTDTGSDDITYMLTNKWVGPDYVNVEGTITWDDGDLKQFRPETVSLSVINSKEEYVKSIQVPVNQKDDSYTFEAKYLPNTDKDGNPLTYSVLESHVDGYTIKYEDPVYDPETHTYICDITNKLSGYFPLTIKKTVKGQHEGEDETFEFEIADAEGDETPDRESPLPLNKDELKIEGEGEVTAQFLIDEDGIYLYSVKEKKGNDDNCIYDKSEYNVLIVRTTDDNRVTEFRSWVVDAEESDSIFNYIEYNINQNDQDTHSDPSGDEEDDGEEDDMPEESSTVEFVNKYADLKIEKNWDIDLENKDRPDSIQVLVQKKDGSKWESVRLVELNSDNDWKASVSLDEGSNGDLRVRELKEETALQELAGKIRDLMKQGKDKYDEWINTIKTEGKTYWDALPDGIREAADNGYDSLIDKLNAKPNELYDKMMEQLAMGLAESRIVYDDKDSDKSGTANEVTYHVDEYTSVLSGGQEDAHITKYKVEYSKDDNTYKIKNTAIIEIDEFKRWISLGVDDDDMPDSVWMVLMAKPKAGVLDNAGKVAGAAGFDISSVLSYEFPVINPIEGGMDPIELLGEMALGIDLGFIGDTVGKIFGISIPEIAVGKADEDGNWKLEFVDKKYNKGIPMEYKGAELSSEIIRQTIKYLAHVDIPVSYNPFDNYISIPTKAIKSIEGIENPSDFLDLSKLSGAALNKAKSLTMDDIKNFGWNTLFTDYHLMANVINLKVDWDDDDEPETVTVEGKKTWNDNNNEANARPESITIRLKANGEAVKGLDGMEEDGAFKVTPDDKGNWTWKFEGLDKEDEDGKEITYTITEDVVEDYTASIDGYNVTNTYTPNQTQLNVTKVWDDGNNADAIRPESVTILLFKEVPADDAGGDNGEAAEPQTVPVVDENGEQVTLILNMNDNWTGSFTGLEKEDENGNEIIYSVQEELTEVITGEDTETTYASEMSGDAVEGYTFTNTHTPENIIISGTKIWDDEDDQDGIRPETITVNLKNGEKVVASIETSKEAGWKYHFPPQPKTDDQGQEIEYTVEEVFPGDYAFADAYEAEIDGYDIINTHTPETVTVKVEKIWEGDQEENRPDSITIRLKADGEELEGEDFVKTVTEEDEWSCEFTGLPKNKDGEEITYTIAEDSVSNYAAEIEEVTEEEGSEGEEDADSIRFRVTNTYNPGKTEVKVEKKWVDSEDNDGIRPAVVSVKLLADGEDTGKTLMLSESANWQGTFHDLDEYGAAEDGSKIEYTVEEVKDSVVTGEDGPGTYACEVSGDAAKGYTITNTHTPETISINVEKQWEDTDDQDGKRPESVIVRLKADGKEKLVRVLSAAEEEKDWAASFSDLPKYKDGKEIEYTITEDAVADYTTEIVKEEAGGVVNYTVTNSYEPGKTEISVTKVWEDQDDHDGIRPESVTVKLLADGEDTGETIVLSEENSFSGSIAVDIMKEGKPVEYSVEEATDRVITGTDGEGTYAFKQRGDATTGFTITNTHTPVKVRVDVKKAWYDNEDSDSIRPESVTVRLLDKGKETDKTLVLSEENNWKGAFTDLDETIFLGLGEHEYSIAEEMTDVITGEDGPLTYASEISGDVENGFTVTNIHTPPVVSISAQKIWDDGDNADGRRPEQITLRLRADGEEIAAADVTAEDDWAWDFGSYPRMQNGQEISYTILEDVVGSYKAEILETSEEEGKLTFEVTNTYTPNKTEVRAEKKWSDDNDNDGIRPAFVTVKLLADGADTGKTLTLSESNSWLGTFTDLDEYGNVEGSSKIEYTVEEVQDSVITGEDGPGTYADEVSGDPSKGYTITNTHTPETITVNVEKQWEDDDDQDGKRPESVTIRLKADGKEQFARTLSAEQEGWKTTFADLPKYKDGKEIEYTITEDAIEDYTSEIVKEEADNVVNYTVTNSYEPGKTEISVTKVWEDQDDHDGIRPESVTVNLLADEKDTGETIVLSGENSWSGSFEVNVMKDGEEVAYSVEEATDRVITGTDAEGTYAFAVSGDATTGYTVTNTHTPTMSRVDVSVAWNDNEDSDGIRPASVTVKLLDRGEETGKTIVLSEENDWKGSFTGLDPVDHEYTIDEEKTDVITGTDGPTTYAYEITGDADGGYTVTNVHTPTEISISGQKIWDDAENEDVTRPEQITIRLKADGEEIEAAEVTEEDDWTWDFGSYPRMKNGKEISYTISEDVVEDYTSDVKGFNVWNHYTPGMTQVDVTKVWDDQDNQDGIRPESVTIELYADGETTERTLVLSEENQWTGSFVELNAETEDGEPISYTVAEVTDQVITGTDAEGTYASEVSGDATTGYTVTNKHTPVTPGPGPDGKLYTITYKLNGGVYNGSPEDIKEQYKGGTVIKIHEKPVREGYTFLYWQGSEYQPGDEYTVTEDHTFVAQWKKNTEVPSRSAGTGDHSNTALWMVIMLISAAVGLLTALSFRRRKQEK